MKKSLIAVLLFWTFIISWCWNNNKNIEVTDNRSQQIIEKQEDSTQSTIEIKQDTPEYYLNQAYKKLSGKNNSVNYKATQINWYGMYDKTFKSQSITWVWATWLNITYDWMKVDWIYQELWFKLDPNQWADWVSETYRWYIKDNTICTIHMIMNTHEYISQKVDISCWNLK